MPTSFNLDLKLSLILHIGDLSYALGKDVLWDVFSAQIEPVAKDIPYMVAIGNHERLALNTSDMRPQPTFYMANDSNGECGVGKNNHEPFIFEHCPNNFSQFQ